MRVLSKIAFELEVGDVIIKIGPRTFATPSPVTALRWTKDELVATVEMYGGGVDMYLNSSTIVETVHPVQELPEDDYEDADEMTAGDGYAEWMGSRLK